MSGPTYQTDQPIYCQTCGIEIGVERSYLTGTVIVMGGAELEIAHGRCRNCLTKWHYITAAPLPPFLARRNA